MKPTEAAALLTIAAAYDNRKPDADQAHAWALILDGLRFEDCREAVVRHYQRSRDWMMPVDVIGGVKKLRAQRVLDFGTLPDPPPGHNPDLVAAHARWLAETTEAIADGSYCRKQSAPVAVGGRDVIRELGQVQSVDSALAVRPLREAHAEALYAKQAAEGERKRLREERQAELERMRQADREARATQPTDQEAS